MPDKPIDRKRLRAVAEKNVDWDALGKEFVMSCKLKNTTQSKVAAHVITTAMKAAESICRRERKGSATPDELRALGTLLGVVHKQMRDTGLQFVDDDEEVEL